MKKKNSSGMDDVLRKYPYSLSPGVLPYKRETEGCSSSRLGV